MYVKQTAQKWPNDCVCTPSVHTESIKLNFNYITKYNTKVSTKKPQNTPLNKSLESKQNVVSLLSASRFRVTAQLLPGTQ